MDVLEHDDRVIHDQANRQHERQQRQQVDRQAQGKQDDESRDDRDRDGYGGNDRGAHASEKQEDDERHQADSDEQRIVNLANGGIDKHGRVETSRDNHAFRQCLVQCLRQFARAPGHVDGVCRRLLDDAHSHHWNAVAAENVAIFHRAALDAGDVAEADQVAIIALRNDKASKIVRGPEGAFDADGECAGI